MSKRCSQYVLGILFALIGYPFACHANLTGEGPPINVDILRAIVNRYMTLAKEAVYGAPNMPLEFYVDPLAPMPVIFPAEGMLPPPGYAYAVLCVEGAGLSMLFLQNDIFGMGGHGWFEAYYADGKIKAIAHNPREGKSKKDRGITGPKIVRVAYLLPEERVQMAFADAASFAKNPSEYNLFKHNCIDTLEVATNSLGIPLPPFRTPTHNTAAPNWLYKQFLNSPYYAPFAHQESLLIDVWNGLARPEPELREQILDV